MKGEVLRAEIITKVIFQVPHADPRAPFGKLSRVKDPLSLSSGENSLFKG
jgi:hypothetical protein